MVMDDTDDSSTDPDQYMEPYDYFAVTSASMEQDFFEKEMAKALEEIFYNLRQLKESRYELEKKRLLSMDNEQELVDEACHEHDEETKKIENDMEKETGSEKQDADNVALLEESRTELDRKLKMDKEMSELEDVSFVSHAEVAEYVRVGPYPEEEVRSENDAENLKESQCELNRRWSLQAEKTDPAGDRSLQHGEELTRNVTEIETTGSEQQPDTIIEVVLVGKENGSELNRRLSTMQLALDVEEANPRNEATLEKQDQASIVQDKVPFPRRRQLPLLPIVKKSP